MRLHLTIVLTISILGNILAQNNKIAHPTFIASSNPAISIKVSEMKAVTEEEWQQMIRDGKKKLVNTRHDNRENVFYAYQNDPVLQDFMPQNRGSNSPLLTFEGASSAFYPSDATGSVDSSYYVQAVNATFSVYDKAGVLKAGPIALNSLFAGLPGGVSNDGDPIVMYDEQANRWLITEMSKSGSNDYLMMAVSQTSSPLGAWYSYSFDVDDWPDYPKYGIWRDAYYIGVDKLSNNTEDQEDVFAVEREKMLLGQAAKMVGFINPERPNTTYSIAAPIDNEGGFAPVNSPGLFVAINFNQWNTIKDQLWLYEMDVDWNNTANSSFGRTQALDVASFSPAPDPIQPGGYSLDGLSSYIMNKPVYRNFSTTDFNEQAIVCCHNVTGSSGANAGLRWYELVKTDTDWEIRQQGTYSPDNDSRWVGSISMNSQHRIAIGYSITGNSTYPGIRYAAQSPSAHADASGLLDVSEETILNGTFIQSAYNRWGDYSNISVDPSNDSIFWYTNQYVGVNNKTKIAKFKFGPFGLAADFITNVVEAETNTIVKIKDISYGNPSTWSWSFSPSTVTYSGGTSSGSQNPMVQFTSPGTYSVSLTVGDGSTNNSLTKTNLITVTAACVVNSFPWSEGFENGGSIPTCWTQDYQNIYNEDWQFVSGDNGATGLHNSAHTGTYNAYFNKNDAITGLVLPKLDLSSLTVPQFDFWYIQDGNSPGYYEFKVLYKASAAAEWSILKTYSKRVSSWTYDTIVLPNNTADSYISIQSSTNSGGYGIIIDDISIKENLGSCADPVGPSSDAGNTSATLSWIDPISSPSWEIIWGTAGFSLGNMGDTISSIATNSYNLTGLTAETSYDWYLRAVCSAGDSSNWVGPTTFTTTKTPYALPVSEGFESGFVKFVNAGGNSTDFTLNTSLQHGGSQSASNNYSSIGGSYLIMNSFVDLSATSFPVLSFWHIAKVNNDGDYCKVQVSTDNGSSWLTLRTRDYGGAASNYSAYQRFDEDSYSIWGGSPADNTWWKKETYVLDSYKNNQVKFRFFIYANNTGFDEGWYIDDILIEDVACPGVYPDSLWTNNITATTAKLKWTEKGSAPVWDIEYGPTGFTQGTGTVISATINNPYTLSGLTANTTYDWYVRSFCGGSGNSEWQGPETFTTPFNPVSLPFFESFEGITPPALPQYFTEEDANNDGMDWGSSIFSFFSGSQSVSVGTPSGKASDDWFFTPGFSLQAGVSYVVAFVYSTSGGHESLELKYGTYPSSLLMDGSVLWSDDDIISWSYALGNATVTPSISGVYYFGFHANSEIGTSGIDLDDIYINLASKNATWTGSSSNDWYSATNWGNDTIPTLTTDVSISSTATNFPTFNKLSLAKNLRLKSSSSGNATLLGESYLRISGQVSIEQFLSAGKWHLLSSPVDTSTTSDLYFNHNPDVWLKEYDEPTDSWSYITSLSTFMPPGAGYAVWVEAGNDTTAVFTGGLNSSDLYLDGYIGSNPRLLYTDASHGYNLLGNPFASALDWDVGSWDTTGIDGSIWVWNQSGSNYVYRNSQGQGSLTNGIIPRNQGFFIRANDANMFFTIPMDARAHSNQGFYKDAEQKQDTYAVVRCVNGENEDEVWISFTDEATYDYDNGYDVEKMFSDGEAPEIYLHENDYDLSILSWPSLEGESRIAHLYFKAGTGGQQELVLKETANMENFDIALEDLKTNTIIDFKKEGVYYFNATTYQNPDRFRLHFTNYITDINEKRGDELHVYSNNGILYIQSGGKLSEVGKDVLVSDMFGRTMLSTRETASNLTAIPLGINNAYIVVRVIAEGKTYTAKVFIK